MEEILGKLYKLIYGDYVLIADLNKTKDLYFPYHLKSHIRIDGKNDYILRLWDFVCGFSCKYISTDSHNYGPTKNIKLGRVNLRTVKFMTEDTFREMMTSMIEARTHFVNAYLYYSLFLESTTSTNITFEQFCDLFGMNLKNRDCGINSEFYDNYSFKLYNKYRIKDLFYMSEISYYIRDVIEPCFVVDNITENYETMINSIRHSLLSVAQNILLVCELVNYQIHENCDDSNIVVLDNNATENVIQNFNSVKKISMKTRVETLFSSFVSLLKCSKIAGIPYNVIHVGENIVRIRKNQIGQTYFTCNCMSSNGVCCSHMNFLHKNIDKRFSELILTKPCWKDSQIKSALPV